MANELNFDAGPGLTGITAYAMLRNATGQPWNTVGSAFENYNAANITDYDLALTEQGASGYFTGNMPAVAAGIYNVTVKQRAGGSPAVSDTRIGGGDLSWTGTAVNWTGNLTTWLGVEPLALSSQQVQSIVPSSTVVASVTGAVGSVTGAVGSVTGSVGSVTGAVGSVTGNVGGNVVGTVASVVGAVGSVTGNVGGNVTGSVASVVTKTGYALASDGLDSVAITAPAGVAANFREMIVQVWRRFFKKSTITATQLKTYADNGTDVLTTQTVSDDLTTQTQGTSA